MKSASGPGTTAGLPAYRTSLRPGWDEVSPAARAAVTERCGSPVVRATSATAGFTPGLASLLECADGSRVFLKGARPQDPQWLAHAYRREAANVAPLPPHATLVPLLWTLEVDDWFFAAYEAVDGVHPSRPWTEPDALRVLDALASAADSLTASASELNPPSWVDSFDGDVDSLSALEPRFGAQRTRHLQDLARAVLAEAPASTLSHDDVRDDNLLLLPDGGVRLVDWSHVMLAPSWFMAVVATISMAPDGIDVRELLAAHRLTREVPPEHVDGVMALHLGYFLGVADLPEVESSPWLRLHQRWYRDALLGWFGA